MLDTISGVQSLQALDYKLLVKEGEDPLGVISESLAEDNINTFISLSQKYVKQFIIETQANLCSFRIKQVKQAPMDDFTSSKIHLLLVNKLLHASVPDSEVKRYTISNIVVVDSLFLTFCRFEECTPYLDKLDPHDLQEFFNPIIFNTGDTKVYFCNN